ncbi:MAG: endopeptidase La [Bdellovibrionaceae bacterium]|nr:endopeptidase La [Pseudobdellovibrionaceae bacterium]
MPMFTGYFPVLPLKNAVIYPGVGQVLRVGREKSVLALNKAHEASSWILTLAQKTSESTQTLETGDLCLVGTLCKVESIRGDAENGYQAILRGHQRVRVTEIILKDFYFQARLEPLEDVVDIDDSTRLALKESLRSLAKQILRALPENTEQLDEMIEGLEDLSLLSYLCAAHIDAPMPDKQAILERTNLRERVMSLLVMMQKFKDNLQIQTEIRSKVSSKLGQTQREHILREQLKTIQEELGDEGGAAGLGIFEKYTRAIENAGLSVEAKKIATQELSRLKVVSPQSPEYHIITNYLDLLVSLPWSKASAQEELDLVKARAVLDADHYGLEKIKKRILQHLAVMKLKNNNRGNILLLIGPPGVGKTSLGQSIAKALGRQYVRLSLGGLRDEAEIRGHRRTYVGAMPGRLISTLKKAGENNPVFVLDEIDKVGRGFQGDPTAALLEVLDPEQNSHFMDHYLEVGFDLSKVFFIATANSIEGIPGPLMDRLEVIEVSGYTTDEKLHIAKNHLLQKQQLEHGIKSDQLLVTDEALLAVINRYSREAGVRELQRKIAAICRATAERLVQSSQQPIKIDVKDLEEILGPERYTSEVAESASTSGVVTGLAWTPAGGEILFIESTRMPGSGHLLITGQLGEVMKESAQLALSFLRSRLPLINPLVDFEKQDIHIHVPAGSIPKDGPSAGIALLTSLASLFSQRRVDPKLAMTGEITLRGAVMPVGGIKEKVLAAHRAGINKIILSTKNKRDLSEVPQEIKHVIQFIFVDTMSEVLKVALGIEVDLSTNTYLLPAALMPPQQGGRQIESI